MLQGWARATQTVPKPHTANQSREPGASRLSVPSLLPSQPTQCRSQVQRVFGGRAEKARMLSASGAKPLKLSFLVCSTH